MDALRALLIMAAISAVTTLPCVVLLLMPMDSLFDAVESRLQRRRQRRYPGSALSRRERRRLARLDRGFDLPAPGPGLAPEADPSWPPIERIAADLRRLRRQRTGLALRSPVWQTAITQAYDDRLALACERLAIPAHLAGLAGVDREIERMRLESELQAAGVALGGYEAAAS